MDYFNETRNIRRDLYHSMTARGGFYCKFTLIPQGLHACAINKKVRASVFNFKNKKTFSRNGFLCAA